MPLYSNNHPGPRNRKVLIYLDVHNYTNFNSKSVYMDRQNFAQNI